MCLYTPMTHPDWVAWMIGDSEFDASVWWLAERDGELAGCALHWNTGWLKDLAVRESERGQGSRRCAHRASDSPSSAAAD